MIKILLSKRSLKNERSRSISRSRQKIILLYDKKNICAVGFEPNPNHVLPLREIELSFAKCGWRTKFFTKTAVSNYTGKRIMVGTWFG